MIAYISELKLTRKHGTNEVFAGECVYLELNYACYFRISYGKCHTPPFYEYKLYGFHLFQYLLLRHMQTDHAQPFNHRVYFNNKIGAIWFHVLVYWVRWHNWSGSLQIICILRLIWVLSITDISIFSYPNAFIACNSWRLQYFLVGLPWMGIYKFYCMFVCVVLRNDFHVIPYKFFTVKWVSPCH